MVAEMMKLYLVSLFIVPQKNLVFIPVSSHVAFLPALNTVSVFTKYKITTADR